MNKAEFTCAEFYHALNEKKLMGTRCKECHTLHLPPRRICPNCHSTSVEWFPMKGEGKLATFTTVAVGTTPMAARGYDRDHHYCCGIVALDEGPRISAHIVGIDSQKPESIKVGTRLKMEPPDGSYEPPVLIFRVS